VEVQAAEAGVVVLDGIRSRMGETALHYGLNRSSRIRTAAKGRKSHEALRNIAAVAVRAPMASASEMLPA
jgi:hypothetical protein